MDTIFTEETINTLKQSATYAWQISGVYVIWSFIHFFSAHLYVAVCTPFSLMGFIAAPFIVASPHCYGLRWCIQEGSNALTSMWLVIGTWIVTHFIPTFLTKSNKND